MLNYAVACCFIVRDHRTKFLSQFGKLSARAAKVSFRRVWIRESLFCQSFVVENFTNDSNLLTRLQKQKATGAKSKGTHKTVEFCTCEKQPVIWPISAPTKVTRPQTIAHAVATYAADIRRISRRIEMPPSETVNHFIQGLKPLLRSCLCCVNNLKIWNPNATQSWKRQRPTRPKTKSITWSTCWHH